MKKILLSLTLAFSASVSLYAQVVGIGTTTPNPATVLHVDAASSTTKGMLFTGVYNAANGTVPNLGAGSRLMFYPAKGAFRAGVLSAGGSATSWDDGNTGFGSVALGSNNIASGHTSTAMGYYSKASGQFSLAIGAFATASGNSSASLGTGTVAKGATSTVIGLYNDSILTSDQSAVETTTPIFIIGNGNGFDARSNAMVVLKNGNTGIGANPHLQALVHVNTGVTTKAFLVTGEPNLLGAVPSFGGGKRMVFFPSKAAFRAGGAFSTEWDNANIGHHSIAMGYGTIASGAYSVAMGDRSEAAYEASTAFGYQTEATEFASTAMGASTLASGRISTAMGYATNARGYASTVVGLFNDPILGSAQTDVTSTTPLLIVGNGASGALSNAMVVLKNGNVGIGTNAPTGNLVLNDADPILQLQNNGVDKGFVQLSGDHLRMGVNATNPTGNVVFRLNGGDRFTIFPTGNATLTGSLTQNSDARLKKNILPICNAMQQLMLINGYHYYWKGLQQDTDMQAGVLAQELQTVFPELVKQDEAGILSVNYSGLIPYMIQAAKEQQKQIESKQQQIDDLNRRLLKLEDALLQKPLRP
jgi:hypothetical protein